jgi:hypothetical protein
MGLTQFDIVLPAAGQPAVIRIDGEDLANKVTRVVVEADSADRIPKVYLEMKGEGRLSGEGIITQLVDLDQRQVVAEWLFNIDPGSLESLALEKLGGLGGGMTTGQAFLAVLKGWVGVDSDGS